MTDPSSLPPPGRARELALKAKRKADALRANLRRRKDQSRARSPSDDPAPVADGVSPRDGTDPMPTPARFKS